MTVRVLQKMRMRVDSRSYWAENAGMKVSLTYILTNFSIALLCRFNFCYGLSPNDELGCELLNNAVQLLERLRGECSAVLMATDQKIFEDLIGCHTRWKILLFLKSTSGSIHLLNIWKKCSNTCEKWLVKASRWRYPKPYSTSIRHFRIILDDTQELVTCQIFRQRALF